jgi:hypothetical protein
MISRKKWFVLRRFRVYDTNSDKKIVNNQIKETILVEFDHSKTDPFD